MMRTARGNFRHYATETHQMVELPYVGDRLAMVVVLPKKRFGVREVEHALTAESFAADCRLLAEQDGTILLPRFKARHKVDDLRGPLIEMGMPLPFSGDADYTGMTKLGLQIERVVHEADIEVDEKGTTAAAATAVILIRSDGFTFRADQPFLFVLRDRSTGELLFIGRVCQPG